nr:Kdo hydroxylase family protein [Pseudomonadota bacterium]
MIEKIAVTSWHDYIDATLREQAIDALESGKVVLLSDLAFELAKEEKRYLSADIASKGIKNIRYDLKTGQVGGTVLPAEEQMNLAKMINRFATDSRNLVEILLPHYKNNLTQARTSYRPVEVLG